MLYRVVAGNRDDELDSDTMNPLIDPANYYNLQNLDRMTILQLISYANTYVAEHGKLPERFSFEDTNKYIDGRVDFIEAHLSGESLAQIYEGLGYLKLYEIDDELPFDEESAPDGWDEE